MTVDYRELNKVIPHLFAVAPNKASLLDPLSHELGTHHYLLDLANAFLSFDVDPESKGQFAFTWEGKPVDIYSSASELPAYPYYLPQP